MGIAELARTRAAAQTLPEEKLDFLVFGSSGYLGQHLCWHLAERGFAVMGVARSAWKVDDFPCVVPWDGHGLGAWSPLLSKTNCVVNLAGRSVNCRYNEKNKAEILSSRLDSTRLIGEAISQCPNPPKVWLNSSTATIYRDSRDRPMDERSGEIGKGFSVDVAQQWEQAFFDAQTPVTRKVALRSSMVMGPGEGGPFEAYHRLVRQGLGGPMAGGGMMVSWIHLDDFCGAVEWLASSSLDGPVNVCSPHPLPNREFMDAIVQTTRKRLAIPIAKWMVDIGAWLMGTEPELPLKSRWVVPGRLTEAGFEFKYPHWAGAARAILSPFFESSGTKLGRS